MENKREQKEKVFYDWYDSEEEQFREFNPEKKYWSRPVRCNCYMISMDNILAEQIADKFSVSKHGAVYRNGFFVLKAYLVDKVFPNLKKIAIPYTGNSEALCKSKGKKFL